MADASHPASPSGRFGKIPVTIVTGFLGAGKTTLIRNVLQTVEGRRLALLINEFGDIGVDADVLRGCGIESCEPGTLAPNAIIELANGCICCTVADDFIPAIETLLAQDPPPEHIIIETSGLALPKPLVKAFDWPEVRRRLTVDGVVAVVDAAADPNVDHDNPLEEVYEDQLLCADLIVLNKTDLIDAPTRARVESDIKAVIPRAVKIVATRDGKLDAALLLGLDAKAEDDLAARPAHQDAEPGHDQDDFDSFVVALDPVREPDQLMRRLVRIAEEHAVLRMKGFVSVDGKPLRLLVQGVGTRFEKSFDRPWAANEARQGRLVVIGEKGLDSDAIRGAIQAAAQAALAA